MKLGKFYGAQKKEEGIMGIRVCKIEENVL